MKKTQFAALLGGGILAIILIALIFSAIGGLIVGTILWALYNFVLGAFVAVPAVAWWVFFVGWMVLSFIFKWLSD